MPESSLPSANGDPVPPRPSVSFHREPSAPPTGHGVAIAITAFVLALVVAVVWWLLPGTVKPATPDSSTTMTTPKPAPVATTQSEPATGTTTGTGITPTAADGTTTAATPTTSEVKPPPLTPTPPAPPRTKKLTPAELAKEQASQREAADLADTKARVDAEAKAATEQQRQRQEATATFRAGIAAITEERLLEQHQFPQALERLATLAGPALTAGLSAEFELERTRIDQARVAHVKRQQERVDQITLMFAENRYRDLASLRIVLKEYLADGGERDRIGRLADRLDSDVPWARESGSDDSGRWATLTVDEFTARLRLLKVGRDAKPVWMSEREFTSADAEALGLRPKPVNEPAIKDLPLTGLSLAGARAILLEMTRRSGLTVRLPTTDEWQWAATVGTPRLALGEDALLTQAWCDDNAKGALHPVAGLPANALGFHDLWGNIAEWTTRGDTSALSGGSFAAPVWHLTRERGADGKDAPDSGFRIVLDP